MQKKLLQLPKGQYLSSLKLQIPANQTTLIVAPTGVGKTTFTMEDLPQQFELVLILVPTQAKVAELQNQYGNSSAKNQYQFFFANQNPDESIRIHKGVIVATYDKYEKINKLMSRKQKEQTLVVLDECHKAYSIGGFRDEAINPIIFSLQQRTTLSILLLTATFTEELYAPLNIPLDHILQIEHAESIQRHISVRYLKHGDHYTHIAFLEKKVLEMRTQNKEFCGPIKPKTILVRINSREKCERAKRYFVTKHGCRCLVVHSKTKNSIEVSDIFENQRIPAGVDIVFTTSIMDEAVNLNNPDFEIDSVCVVGKQAHVEELVQFLGRLRTANVPCELLLHTEMKNEAINFVSDHQKHLKRMRNYISRVSTVAKSMSALMHDFSLDFFAEIDDREKQSIYDKIKRLNESFNDFIGCKLFTVYQGKPEQNIASLVATLYRMDAAHCYSNFNYLAKRIRDFLPNCFINFFVDSNMVTPTYIKDFCDAEKAKDESAYDASIDNGLSFFLNHFSTAHNSEINTLKDISDKFIKEKSNTEDYLESEVLFESPTHPDQMVTVVEDTIYLAQHVSNLHDIKAILQARDSRRVIVAGEAYADNVFIQTLVQDFYTRQADKCFSGEYRLNGVQAVSLLQKAINKVQKKTHIPMRTIIRENLIKGMKYDDVRDEFEISESKALNYFSNYFELKDKNKNKPKQRYLEFHGIAVGGYQYICLESLQANFVEKHDVFTLGDERYDSYTGRKKAKKVSIEEIFAV
ncbi:DEAD/DEAH box helicase [Acinetobacter sp. SH20PTE14]|uniref:DEAD/DEAH box helicase n=1 Tax=Acinetobacter sp. SH20PTE14 TaxID=2905879 RepID=UPI001F3D05EE|nr:DEAD/DEAH box helicase family protein [Acinetobacter sp. SH20PTE14]UIJ77446.1 DEAD/DEAH box helicase family protein [Acinetobacter sp. SH20PTE14]